MTVREFLRTVWDGKWYVLAAVVIVMAAALVYLNRQVTVYRATATVQLSSVQTGGDQSTAITANPDPTNVTSEPVAAAVAQTVGGGASPATLAADVTAAFDPGSQTMVIQAETESPELAATLANDFATAYVDYMPQVVKTQQDRLNKQIDAINDQITAARATLLKHPKDPKATALQTSGTATLNALTGQVTALTSLAPPAQVASRAGGAEPLGLSRETVLALSFLAGLAAGVGLAFARRGLDFHLRTVAQASEITDAPVLAEIDGVRRALKDAAHHGRLPVASRVATPYTESIRELRTAVQVSVKLRDHVAIVVTAADPSAPRSFITANLAASLALSGRRTIAFSADMRRPELDDILPAPEDWQGGTGLRPTRVPNLSLFPVPDQLLDPADFLATAQARDLVDSLRAQADVLIIDAPPVLAAADATILGSYSDGVVLIASVGKTDELVLVEAVKRLRVNNVPLAGLAVEGVTGSRRMTYASTYGEAAAAAAHAVAPGEVPSSATPTAAPPEPEASAAASADVRPVAIEAETQAPAAAPPIGASRRPGPGHVEGGPGPLAAQPLAGPAVVPGATPGAAPVAAAPAIAAPKAVAPSGSDPGRTPTAHRHDAGKSGRPRIMPAWSPVSTTRPPTAAMPVVGTDASVPEEAAESGQRAAS